MPECWFRCRMDTGDSAGIPLALCHVRMTGKGYCDLRYGHVLVWLCLSMANTPCCPVAQLHGTAHCGAVHPSDQARACAGAGEHRTGPGLAEPLGLGFISPLAIAPLSIHGRDPAGMPPRRSGG